MGIVKIIQEKKEQILSLVAKRGALNIHGFVSLMNGKSDKDSDIYFLVYLKHDQSLFDFGGLLMDLQKLINWYVNVVSENVQHWYIKERILKGTKPI